MATGVIAGRRLHPAYRSSSQRSSGPRVPFWYDSDASFTRWHCDSFMSAVAPRTKSVKR
jgi:hypothetical protein